MGIKELFDLSGRVALVTGGSRGLGLQMAEALGDMGAKVAITARKAKEIAQWGRIDILVNNAGTTWGAPMEDHPLEAWQKIIALNLTAMFLLTQAVGKMTMIPRRTGRIINIASIAGLSGTEPAFMSTIGYNTTKAGVVNFTKSLACEWGKYNIHVNAIAPGVFPSKMSKGMIDSAGKYILDNTPLRRLGGDRDLKGATVLLASDASDFMTGTVIPVDGGFAAL